LLQKTYGNVIKILKELQLLPKGSFKIDEKTSEADYSLVNIFHSDCKFSSGRNYYEMFILANGALFISEPMLTEIL